jgi:hypothetical protein
MRAYFGFMYVIIEFMYLFYFGWFYRELVYNLRIFLKVIISLFVFNPYMGIFCDNTNRKFKII